MSLAYTYTVLLIRKPHFCILGKKKNIYRLNNTSRLDNSNNVNLKVPEEIPGLNIQPTFFTDPVMLFENSFITFLPL